MFESNKMKFQTKSFINSVIQRPFAVILLRVVLITVIGNGAK